MRSITPVSCSPLAANSPSTGTSSDSHKVFTHPFSLSLIWFDQISDALHYFGQRINNYKCGLRVRSVPYGKSLLMQLGSCLSLSREDAFAHQERDEDEHEANNETHGEQFPIEQDAEHHAEHRLEA